MSTHAASVLLGAYPERRAPATKPGWAVRLTSALLRFQPMAAKDAAFVADVRAKTTGLRELQGETWRQHVIALRARLACDGARDELRVEALAVVTVASERALGLAPFDTQLIAAWRMLDGYLAEMATGEGKTLAAALTAGVAALAGTPVHVLTANDYLVARDHEQLSPLYAALGLSAGAVTGGLDQDARRAAYACDITYCTAKELVFDYLRDGLAGHTAVRAATLAHSAASLSAVSAQATARPLLRGLHMAVIDEADSLLIDEARVPLILSRTSARVAQACVVEAWRWSGLLLPGSDFVVDEALRSVRLTAAGRDAVRTMTGASDTPWLNQAHREERVTQALTARHVLKAGRDYVVEDGRVHLVDETTGRKATGRAWSQGLQQLVELSAGCALSPALDTVAQITYQRFFPRYLRLCGMSGTLWEARAELAAIYRLAVAKIPLRLKSRREHWPAHVFATTADQWLAVAQRAGELHAARRPVLIGVDSVNASQALSQSLARAGVAHVVLNALQDKHEAQVIARAGMAGAVTVATNMAGRGTDIVLDDAARDAGGLHVISCQQNTSRRVDRQLAGRCARQGEPGSHEYFVALEGPLLADMPWRSMVEKMLFTRCDDGNGVIPHPALSRGERVQSPSPAGRRVGMRETQWTGQNAGRMPTSLNFSPAAATALAWRRWQQARWTRVQRRERASLLRRDERLNDSLAFGGTAQ